MSYEVLARRFRPQTFDEVEGQRHVVTALRNALQLGRVPHALLFAGPRGVGKTTLARILARSLNCDDGPTAKPCGRCSSCLEIAAGTSLDVQEIDAASNTGVDNVREIRESVRYAAAPGKHRIFIIDEVHMLSTAAFNALLKTLEEPPPRSLFVFATTDPQKIPVTVLSRVQRFDLRRLGPAELLKLLKEICRADGIEAPESVLRALVREADGSGRDALTMLDRLTSAMGPKLAEAEAIAILDLVDRKLLVDVLDPVLEHDPARALAALRRALEQGVEPMRLASDLLAELRDLVVARLVDDPSALVDAAPEQLEELRARARAHDAETLQRLFRVLLSRMQELPLAARQEQALEMAIVRLATLPEAEALGALVQRLDALDSNGAGPGPGPGATTPRGPGAGPGPSAPPRTRAGAAPAERGPSGARPASGEAARSEPKASEVAAVQAERGPSRARPASGEAARSEPKASEVKQDVPPPDDAEYTAALNGDEAAAPLPTQSALTHEQRSRLEGRMRAEARAHPQVQAVIDALDAELREIRVDAHTLQRGDAP